MKFACRCVQKNHFIGNDITAASVDVDQIRVPVAYRITEFTHFDKVLLTVKYCPECGKAMEEEA